MQSRKQFVTLDEIEHSDLFQIATGVPQGSTLGPLLFLLYVNELVNCTSVTSILFADDTCLSFSASYRHFNKKLPTNLQNYFTNVNTCHSIATRRQACGLNYHIPRYRSSKLQRSIKYKGVKIWNLTLLEIRKFNLDLYLKSY